MLNTELGHSENSAADPHVSTVQDFRMEDAMLEASRAPSSVRPVTPPGVHTVITNTLRQNDALKRRQRPI